MDNKEIIRKVHDSMYRQLQKNGVAVPVQVLMDLGVLSVEDHENWRFGQVDYLERVCRINLHKLAGIMKEIRTYARKNSLKASWTFYRQWGRKGKEQTVKLRFSKSGNETIENGYATHYILAKSISERREDNGSVDTFPSLPAIQTE